MIPLGVLASVKRASAAPTVVQTKTASSTNTITLDSAPIAGNLLVLGVGNALATPASWTYSHTLALNLTRNQNGWDAALVSGVVLDGDSATITITGMNSGFPRRIIAWELSGVTAYSTGQTAGGNSISTASPSSIATGSIALSVNMFGGDVTAPSATGMTSAWANSRLFAAQALAPSLPFSTTIAWTTDRDAACLLGGYA